MMISALQTDSKEIEAMDYVWTKEFAYFEAGICGGFKNTKDLHVMKYRGRDGDR